MNLLLESEILRVILLSMLKPAFKYAFHLILQILIFSGLQKGKSSEFFTVDVDEGLYLEQ